MSPAFALRAAGVVLAAALLQTVVVSSLSIAGGAPDLLLVAVVSLGLLRGASAGAVLGFLAGLVVDLLALETLGITSLVLTLAGYWAGRYAETTGRGKRLAPLAAVGVITVLATVFGLLLHVMLGEAVAARETLLGPLPPTLAANLVLALPVHALVRLLVHGREEAEPVAEVELVG
ncbi:MAG TPA: rod shape-determining protein MreD [Gaiellaceae bacterium]|nr:rod shape-determining protein MreD [Gaiellaceae bacterium]